MRGTAEVQQLSQQRTVTGAHVPRQRMQTKPHKQQNCAIMELMMVVVPYSVHRNKGAVAQHGHSPTA